MTATIALMVGISIGCLWMGICVFAVIWWSKAVPRTSDDIDFTIEDGRWPFL